MTLKIDLPPQTEAWLQSEAYRRGTGPAEIITSVLNERAAQSPAPAAPPAASSSQPPVVVDPKTAAAIAFLNARIAEGVAADPETRRQADEEVEEFKRNMNANRAATGERLVFP